jgi:CIC family chloride channel protein
MWWAILLVPAVGGLLSGTISCWLAPDTRGAGTNELIDAFHNKAGRVRRRVPIVRLITTMFTLGSGGSAGREGPMAHIGAGFGSYVATKLHLNVKERRLLLLAGAAGGISALFRAPLGAALWSLEVLYRDDFESDGMFPCLVSSVTAYSVFTLLIDQGALFHVPVSYSFHPAQLGFYAILGLGCALLGKAWTLWMERTRFMFARLPIPGWSKPAFGGLLLGALVLGVPWVFSSGFFWVQDSLLPIDSPARHLPVGKEGFILLFGIALAKMVATSFTVSSGGSGGTFAPSLFIGGMMGGAFGLLFHEIAPSVVPQPGAFVFVGMAAFYAGISKTPLATIILVSELFGSYDLLVPIMFTEMISVVLLRNVGMYPAQVSGLRESPAHLADFTVDILKDLKVRDHYTEGRASETLPATMNLQEFLEHVSSTADSFFVVHNPDGELTGIVSLSNVRSVVSDHDFLQHMLVTDAMWPLKSVESYANLDSALQLFLDSGYDHLPVIDPSDPHKVLGMLSQQQIFAAYNAELLRRRLEAPVSANSEADS